MKALASAAMLAALAFACPAEAQNIRTGGASDPCEAQANQQFSHIRDLETRMKTKRQFIMKCRAEARGKRP